jgi:phosphohistidine swiveling domain-containing protein
MQGGNDGGRMSDDGVLGSFHGDDAFPVTWDAGERERLWVFDDLHCPNPLSPMFFDIGGWWLTCDHMFRRFGTPFASDWIAKNVNGYLYTAAIPADDVAVEGAEYNARYVPRVPRLEGYAAGIGGYLGAVLPHYGTEFSRWWADRLRPEIERNFAYLDGIDMDALDLVPLAVLLEDAIDVHDRHWKIHWMINFAQFSATLALGATIAEVKGDVDPGLPGRLQSSVANRNWDSIEALWKMKNEVRDDPELRAAFGHDTAAAISSALAGSETGRRFVETRVDPYRAEFGRKSIWSHEFVYPTWFEQPAPILQAVRGYLESDYDYPAEVARVKEDLEAACAEVMDGVPPGEGRDKLQGALDASIALNPLTPDHHFFIDQGTNARLRLILVAIGRKLAAHGALGDPEDVFFLKYNELRMLIGGGLEGAAELVSRRRDEREDAFELRPPDWIGTATADQLAFPYLTLWGFPEKFHRERGTSAEQVVGLAASPGIAEGSARIVSSLDQFNEVEDGEILVCSMTNPAWVVLFTKIRGLVTEAGGTTSHPAVVAREFGIPAVVGTGNAGERIKTGDRIRVNGSTGVVEILG